MSGKSADVIELGKYTLGRIPPERIKDLVEWDELEDVLVIGMTKGGGLASWGSTAEIKENLFLCHVFMKEIL